MEYYKTTPNSSNIIAIKFTIGIIDKYSKIFLGNQSFSELFLKNIKKVAATK